MRVHIGGDHASYELQRELVTFLREAGYDVVDHGPLTYDDQDDYPVSVLRAAQGVASDVEGTLGVVLGGSGNGEQMAANKVRGVRAALCYNTEVASLAREHNNAQVISIGARMNTAAEAKAMVTTFLTTAFSGARRHARRLEMMARFEQDGTLPPMA